MDCGTYSDLFIQKYSFWPRLSANEKQLLCNQTRPIQYDRGRHIYDGVSGCVGLLLVKSGQVRIYIISPDGREVTLSRLFSGGVCIMSAACALDAVNFNVFIDADEDTEVLLTSQDAFNQLSTDNIYVKCFGYELAAAQLSDMLWKMQQILFMSADRRLAVFLLTETEKTGSPELKITHEQVARYMGSAREVVSRLLKYFSTEGIVRQERGAITVLDAQKLRELAG